MSHSPDQLKPKNGSAPNHPFGAPPVSIAGIGLCCQAGTAPFALFGAVGTNLSGVCAHDCLEAPLPGKKGNAPILCAPISHLEGLNTPHDRITALAQIALAAAAEQIPKEIPGEAILVITLIPATQTPRGQNLDLADLEQQMASCHPRVDGACFRFVPIDQGSVESLQEACAELQQDKWQAVLYGGVDSLIDIVTCSELVYQRNAMPQGGIEGIIPGEGAAYLVLQKQASDKSLAQINAVCTAPEPHNGQAHDKQMTGMAAAIKATLQHTDISPEKLDSIVIPFGGRMVEALEWHQVVEAVWPRRENVPRMFEVLRPGITLGETGAASLPLGLALGCARFEFEFPGIDNLLVCSCHPSASRGAVSLTKVITAEYEDK